MSVALVLLASVAAPVHALAQEENEGEEETSTVVSRVRKQNGCVLLVKNDSKLKPQEKVTVTSDQEDMANGIVRSSNANGMAVVVLEQKSCKLNFTNAQVVAAQAGRGDSGTESAMSTGGKSKLPEGVKYDSSAHNRIKYPVSARFGGGYMFSPGVTGALGYSFNHEFMAELAVDSSSLEFLKIYNYSRLRIGALGSYYAGNSFYTSGGLILENFSAGLIGGKIDDNGVSTEANAFKADFLQLQAQIGIGNRWNLGRLIMGSEWVGISIPVANLSESYSKSAGYSDEQFEASKKSNSNFADSKSLRLLNVYIGFSF
jgi:hypothetical protein